MVIGGGGALLVGGSVRHAGPSRCNVDNHFYGYKNHIRDLDLVNTYLCMAHNFKQKETPCSRPAIS